MRIGLIDVDGHHFPNLPLMKLSAYHKALGDAVEWYEYGLFNERYDRVYCAKVFSGTPDFSQPINADKVIRGGTGYDIRGASLPDEIEHIYPDYSLYGIEDTAYGFLTRGCPRGCSFCIVGDKEGRRSVKVANLDEFWSGQKNIVLCDPNILACREWEDLLGQLAESKAWVDFNQGLDARLLSSQKIEALNRIKMKEIHFAWDNYGDGDIILPKLEMFAKMGKFKKMAHKAIVYVLCNYDTTIEQDLERVYRLRDLGYWAYIMLYDKEHADKDLLRLQRWCNNRFIFSTCKNFKDYDQSYQKHLQQPADE